MAISEKFPGHRPALNGEGPVSDGRLRVCIVGLGGGGFHWEAQRIIRSVQRPLDLVLVFAGPAGGLVYWDTQDNIKSTYIARSPSLTGDRLPGKIVGVLHNIWQALRILHTERPDVILAVGTAQAVPFGVAARILGRQLWFVESITRMRAPCRTGKWVSRLKLASRLYYYSEDLVPHYPGGICMESRQR